MSTHKDKGESYIHYYAKQVLMQWLGESHGKFFSLRWSKEARIRDEYPLIMDNSSFPLHGCDNIPWDEIPCEWRCNCPVLYTDMTIQSAVNPCNHRLQRDDNIPTREEVLEKGFRLGAIIDVVIIDEGRVKYMFEVVHTSGLTHAKRGLLCKYIERWGAIAYEVDADYILRQVCKPSVWRGVKVKEESKERRKWKVKNKKRLK